MLEQPQIPGVELEGELGRGAYSIVYKGHHGPVRCAVKIPRAKGRWTRWAYREAVALARVRDPGLPAVLEVGVVDDQPYIVMELVEGETLAERLAHRKMTEGEIVQLGISVARTLSAVHDAGLIHRDVKPRNIVLEESGRVRLVDFGFAAPVEGVSDKAGTPRYAAPEQFRTSASLDHRSDLYGLGRVLFEAATGELRVIASPEAGRPSKVESELRAAGSSEGLVRVICGLVAFDPADRYPDARALYCDLDLLRTEKRAFGPAAFERTRRHPTTVLRTQELERVVDEATKISSGVGTMIRIQGDPGSGKTAFMAACATAIERTRLVRVIDVRCRETDPPLAAIGRLLDGFAVSLRRGGREEAFVTAVARHVTDQLASIASIISPTFASLLRLDQTGAAPLPSGFAENAAELLIRLARAEPLVIIVDDAQWIDPASRDVFSRLRFRVGEAAIGLIVATRPEIARRDDDGRSKRLTAPEPGDVEVKFGPLTESQIAKLITSHLGVPHVEAALVRRVATLAEDTPLGVLEVLRALLDAGALRPQSGSWLLDVARAEKIELPAGAIGLLGRRVDELPRAARKVLEAAAIVSTEFEVRLLEEVLDLRSDELAYGLADARRAGLIANGDRGKQRFVHDSLREMLEKNLGGQEARDLHQRAAEALATRPDRSLDELFAAASHFSLGDPTRKPELAYRSALAAARAAIGRFDNETALEFLELARRSSEQARIELGSEYFRDVGEVNLRLGRLDQAARSFRDALARADSAYVRARVSGRIAWVHQSRDDPDAAWRALENAFRELGVAMPDESVKSGVHTLGHLAMAGLRGVVARASHAPSVRELEVAELLCDLHYQNARLAMEYGKPLRVLQSTLQSVEACKPLGRSRPLARARAFKGCIMTAIGRQTQGAKDLDSARALAESLGDPQTTAFCAQLRWLGECFAGRLDDALILIDEFLDVHGPWLELAEFCHGAANADSIASIRGQPRYGWQRLELAVERIRRSGTATAAIEDWVMHRARADLIALGRSVEGDPWLSKAFARVATSPTKPTTFLGTMAWGPRARAFVEAGDLGPEFERLVQSFEAEAYRPSSAHPLLAEYYIAVAHARMHQSFSDPHHNRRAHLPALKKAAGDLRQAAKLALFRAHAALADAHVAWLEDKPAEMRIALAEAESLADAETCAWVLYGVERLRAHALLESGKRQAAVDRARFAETIALEHGAARRARWVREEFALSAATAALAATPAATTATSSWLSSTSSSRHRQLAALLHAVHAPQANLTPEQQAIAVLDELLADFDAEHAFLYFSPADSSSPLRIGRTRRATPWTDLPDGRFGLIEAVRERGEMWPPPAREGESTTLLRELTDGRVVVAPLSLYETTVGAVLIERAVDARPFGDDERQLLGVLMHQIPIALELSRVLAERQELELSLRQARKMEAVGQLAGGVAHDFNNMLQAIRAAAEVVRGSAGLGPDAVDEIEVISQAADRATSLTRQLLAFSRHRPAPLTTHGLGVLLDELEPLLKRVGAKHVSVALSIAPDPMFVRVDRPALEQAIVNLIKNAGDAMPDGGTVTVSASSVDLDSAAVRRGAPKPGPYVALRVADHGHGIKPELLERVFEPFFTTKAFGSNTGLGLTTVYAFAKNSDGYVEVSSAVGRGTTVSLFLPRVAARSTPIAPEPRPRPTTVGKGELILVIDDEPLVARSTCKILERHGFQVIVAGGGQEALDAVRDRAGDIRLAVIDVVMPDMSGPEVARRLVRMGVVSRRLFVSGYAASEGDAEADELLQKPFTPEELVARVRDLIDA